MNFAQEPPINALVEPQYPPPREAPAPGMRWVYVQRWVLCHWPHTVTAAEVRHAIIYGGPMKTAGQVLTMTSERSQERWEQRPLPPRLHAYRLPDGTVTHVNEDAPNVRFHGPGGDVSIGTRMPCWCHQGASC